MRRTMTNGHPSLPGFRPVPMTGVIYVTSRAAELGYASSDPAWANLGQGAPEAGEIEGAPPRVAEVAVPLRCHEYAPVAGLWELREHVAHLYNTLYRGGVSSLYTAENVAISSGGRLALARIAASIGNINMGHLIPDYTAYEELLTIFRAFTAIPLLLKPEEGYVLEADELREHILGLGLGALLLSNPCNPTGQHVRGTALREWVQVVRECNCTCVFDEFYSHYTYGEVPGSTCGMVSAAEFVEDVDRDPVIIVDGLTKNWRYPGWRISWTLAPRSVIAALASAGSFLDGGAPHPLQEAAIPLLRLDHALQEARALRLCFQRKREYALRRLGAMGITVEHPPQGGFYCWVNLSSLPPPLNDGMQFFEEGLRERVITVPGEFFDVNPGKRRPQSRYKHYARISFGPDMATLERGCDALERIIHRHRSHRR